MVRQRVAVWWVCALAACGQAATTTETDSGLPLADAGDAGAIEFDVGLPPDGATLDEGVAVDAGATPTDAGAADAEVPADVATGCSQAGCACTSNGNCDSGLCIEAGGESVCAQTCSTTCPSGFDCKTVTVSGGDTQSVCVPRYPRLCEPCKADADCATAQGGATAKCVPYQTPQGLLGSFCGGACDAQNPCPIGYTCADVAVPGGAVIQQCKRTDLSCPCDGRAVKLGLGTTCTTATAAGACGGQRACTANGLTACDAPLAVSETCNDVDDNCNGKTDEPGPMVCNDGNTCTYDNCVAGSCQHLAATGPCSDACTTSGACNNGACVGQPVNCDDGKPCTIDACALPGSNTEVGGCIHTVTDGAGCSDGNACSSGDTCKGDQCVAKDSVVCDDNNPCTTDSCAPGSGCVYAPNTLPCSDGSVCTTTDQCAAGACVGGKPLPCNDGNPCTADGCDKATGCTFEPTKADCTDNNACTVGDSCQDGICLPGAATVCDDGNVCTADSCAPKTGCTSTPATVPCSDGNVCTQADTCVEGVCSAGLVLVCNDGNPCTTDNCDAKTGCVFKANTAPCDDGSVCTSGDTCQGGVCKPGQPAPCDDGNPCTSEICDPAGGCTPVNNKLPCDDGDACTSADVCQGGSCVGTKPVVCNDGNPCTDDACEAKSGCSFKNSQAPCNDGSACTTGDACDGGLCIGGAVVDCSDGNACTDDVCNPKTGCASSNNQLPCSDGNACTQLDACAGGKCAPGGALSCSDGNPCTDDGCAAKTGCAFVHNAAACSDGNVCTTKDVCNAGVCLPGAAQVCDDGNGCTADACDPVAGCTHAASQAACDDGNACTIGDTCQGGACKPTGDAACDDGNPCTDDSCNAKTGCTKSANTAGCDDGNACTSNDKCDNGQCKAGSLGTCDDGNPCTTDLCDASKGCVTSDNTAGCDDGNLCTTGETCAAGKCLGGKAVDCNDGNVCTDDVCSSNAGCVYAGNSKSCDDGNACTAGDVCFGGKCKAGNATSCDDGLSCTSDSCVVNGGVVTCQNTPAPGSCVINGKCADASAGYASCSQVQGCLPSAKSGVYSLDPDGPGGAAAFDAFCELGQDGGGWTLAMNLNTSDATMSTLNGGIWTAGGEFGAFAKRWATDYKSWAAHKVSGTALLLIVRNTTDAEGAGVVGWRSWNLSAPKTFQSFFDVSMGSGCANASGGCNGGASGDGRKQTSGVKSAGVAAPYDTFTGFANDVYSNSYYGNCTCNQDGFRLSSWYRWANNSNVGLGLYMDDSDSNGFALEAGAHMKIDTYTNPQRFCSGGCSSCTAFLDGSQAGSNTKAAIGSNHNGNHCPVPAAYRYEWYIK